MRWADVKSGHLQHIEFLPEVSYPHLLLLSYVYFHVLGIANILGTTLQLKFHPHTFTDSLVGNITVLKIVWPYRLSLGASVKATMILQVLPL